VTVKVKVKDGEGEGEGDGDGSLGSSRPVHQEKPAASKITPAAGSQGGPGTKTKPGPSFTRSNKERPREICYGSFTKTAALPSPFATPKMQSNDRQAVRVPCANQLFNSIARSIPGRPINVRSIFEAKTASR